MEYLSNQVSKMSGVSARTLRYYDEIGLLKPRELPHRGIVFMGRPSWTRSSRFCFTKKWAFRSRTSGNCCRLPILTESRHS